ncbi:LppX_LprAFG lipoprotein [Streptomyces albireticuli]|uniref:LppX_LprAFG lipoprotein n=1 Tax=Streptomyces albireticuli TaxID=1940 RepID=UPI00369424E3
MEAAVEATSGTSARVDERIETDDEGEKQTVSITGEVDMARDSGRLHVGLDGTDLHIDQIFANGKLYVKGVDQSEPETWGYVARDGLQAHHFFRAPGNDPKHVLWQITAMHNVKKAGEERVNGARTVRYSGDLDIDAATLGLTKEMKDRVLKEADAPGSTPIARADVWVDDQGRVVRIRMSQGPDSALATVTITLSDLGKPVETKAPAKAAEVELLSTGLLMG